MRKRIIFSVLFIPLVAGAIYAQFLKGLPFFFFVLLISALASREVHDLLCRANLSGVPPALRFILPPAILITASYVKSFVTGWEGAILLYIVTGTVLLYFIFTLISRGDLRHLLSLLAGYVYTGVFPLFILELKWERSGMVLLYFFFLIVWMNDAAAYFVGTFYGRTRGIVKISPNKSIEGYVGGALVTFAVANAFEVAVGTAMPLNLLETNLVTAVLCITAPAGDLIESMLKRRAGVKDSSNLIPGLGGILDIFDSALFSAPFYYFVINLFL